MAKGGVLLLMHLLAILIGVTSTVAARGRLQPARVSVEENESPVSAFYIMGDSSVDCGDNTLFYPYLHGNISLLPCSGSDSTLLPHFLANRIGLPNSPTFYGQNGTFEGLKRGLNYGSAEARILNPGSESPQSLNQQLRQVMETFQLLQLQLKEEASRLFVESSIFYLSFGKDDYVDLFLSNHSDIMLGYTGQEFAKILVDQMVHAMRSLYDANVRKIICLGILPLGCTPRTVWEWDKSTAVVDGRGCIEEVNQLVVQYNTMLDERIGELNAELPDAHIIFCDVYQGIMEVITHPEYYGFNDVKNACCGLGPYGAAIGCLSMDMSCDQSYTHVWWDLYNPTEALNFFLADAAWSGHDLPSICRPTTVQELVYATVSHLD